MRSLDVTVYILFSLPVFAPLAGGCGNNDHNVRCDAGADAAPALPLSPGDLIALPNPYKTDPVPAISVGPAIPMAKGYLVQPLGGNVYAVLDGAYQTIFVTTGSGVIVVDAPPSLGTHLLDAVAATTIEPITHVIYSHHHNDHIGSADMFPAGVTRIAQTQTAALLAADHDPHRPLPTVTFDTSYTLTVGTETLQLDYHGNVHDPGNIFIYAPREKVLMVVDVVFPGWVPFDRLAVSQNIPNWIAAHDTILGYDFTWYVGGHVTRIGTREDVQLQRQYVQDLRAAAAAALQTVQFGPLVPKVDRQNPWALSSAYLGSVAEQCAVSQIAKYRGKLGAVDLHAYDHCWTMMESLRID